jgi:shikimate kinase
MNLVLVGYRGTGKSLVATLLGSRCRRPVVSLDQQIVERAGKSIPEIVAERGWPGFRDLEQAVCAEYAAMHGQVLDCGGGIVERPANVLALRHHGRIVWLRAEVATIVARIQGDTQRPSLTGRGLVDEIAEVLARRTPLYQSAADLQVMTDGVSPTLVAQQIEAWFTSLGDSR